MVKGMKSMTTEEKWRRWDPAVTAAEVARENCTARQGRKDETNRECMKSEKLITSAGVKCWRLGTKAL